MLSGGGKNLIGGGKWGRRGREVGEKGEGSGGKGGGNWERGTPLSTPSSQVIPAPYLNLRAKYIPMPSMPRGRANPGLP